MDLMIKINEVEYELEHMSGIIDSLLRDGQLIELKKGEFFWTKKHFVKGLLGMSKIVPFPNKVNIYLFAFHLQFTDLYSQWMNQKYFSIY